MCVCAYTKGGGIFIHFENSSWGEGLFFSKLKVRVGDLIFSNQKLISSGG